MAKDIKFKEEVMAQVINGVEILSRSVGSTLGPGGRNVVIQNYGWPIITKDGVSVARQVELSNKFENIGCQMVKQVADKTCKDAGDGTTTATILAEAILKEGYKYIVAGHNPIEIQRGISKCIDKIIDFVKNDIKIDINETEWNEETSRLKQIALVSTNWDEELSSIIAEAITIVGSEGRCTVNDSKTNVSSLRFDIGMTYERGFMTPYFINDLSNNKFHVVNENNDLKVLLWGKKITNFRDISGLLGQCTKNNYKLLVIAPEVEANILQSMAYNIQNNVIKNICFIKSPYMGDKRESFMEDLGIYLGCEYFGLNSQENIATLELSQLGSCEEIIVDADKTTIINGNGSKEELKERISQIKKRLEVSEYDWEQDILKERILKLNALVAFLYIGSKSEIELKEKKDRVEDAICSTKAAMEEGIVPGGSYALIRVFTNKEIVELSEQPTSEGIGAKIVLNAIKSPLKVLLINAGKSDLSSDIINKMVESEEKYYGYNIKKEKFSNLMDDGVIDAFKVTRTSLENAGSIAGLMLTTECIIADELTSAIIHQESPIPNLF